MRTDCGQYPVWMLENLGVREAEHGPAESFQPGLSQMIPENDLVEPMDPAVDLDDEPQAITGEIGEVATDWMLSAKPVAVDLGLAQAGPQALLRQTCAFALVTCERGALAGHTGRLALPPQQ